MPYKSLRTKKKKRLTGTARDNEILDKLQFFIEKLEQDYYVTINYNVDDITTYEKENNHSKKEVSAKRA
jgi:hypothetical protein